MLKYQHGKRLEVREIIRIDNGQILIEPTAAERAKGNLSAESAWPIGALITQLDDAWIDPVGMCVYIYRGL
jgi:hypothetical protein